MFSHRIFRGQNIKSLLQAGLGLVFVLLGVYFVRHEEAELGKVKASMIAADPWWILVGLLLVILFVGIQGKMYQYSFRSIHANISLSTAISLYLKRNLISVFLPAGVLTNMLFFNQFVERREGVSKVQIFFASTIFSICSVATGVIVGVPAIFWLFARENFSNGIFWSFLLTIIILLSAIYAIYNVLHEGFVFRILDKYLPVFTRTLKALSDQSYNRTKVFQVLVFSMIIEIIGIVHLYITMLALHLSPTWEEAFIGYAVVLLLLMCSPFLRGVGAVEVSLTYVLTFFGLTTVMGISVAFLFRFFEFWVLLVLGLLSLIAQRDNLFLRVLPALLIFFLGLINILSAITPGLPTRIKLLEDLLPSYTIYGSIWFVLFSGIVLLFMAINLLRGLRNAWIGALILSCFSLVAHLTKGIDWEEASVAFITMAVLIYQRKQYFVKTDLRLARMSLIPAGIIIISILIFGALGFYFIDVNHYQLDFSIVESFRESIRSFFLLDPSRTPLTAFARQFTDGMHILGGISLAYLAFLIFRPFVGRKVTSTQEEVQVAKDLLKKNGKSSLDYFKTYFDKEYWFDDQKQSFVSFKIAGNYAIVLENPVCVNDAILTQTIVKFDHYCLEHGLHAIYYRIPEVSKPIYEHLKKKLLPIGEEAIVDLQNWSIEGSSKKALRNTINKMTRERFEFKIKNPPQNAGFLQQLRAVSDEWLHHTDRSEIIFSQGLFSESELKDQTILYVEDEEGKIMAFINLIPDFANGESTFDLMRKTHDAPGGSIDFIFVNMFEYLKSNGYTSCNIGMVPLSGLDHPENLQEKAIKLAYENIKQLEHYRTLRSFKAKFDPTWKMAYVAYSTTLDLIYLPVALQKVIQP